ncbi:MAG: GNAT family N-acetyltransferase [Polyangiaceae bacterium]|nr:GNAT family N-acetyltransferase [Polyangiaceae bacterium]
MLIRPACLEDADAIAEVQVASWHAAYRGLMPDDILRSVTFEARSTRWRSILSVVPPMSRTTVGVRDDRVVAFASVGDSRDGDGMGEVWALYAHPTVWSTGAGRALLVEGIVHLGDRGFDRIILWVLAGNARAIRFYEAAGFRLDGAAKTEDRLPHLRMQRAVRLD